MGNLKQVLIWRVHVFLLLFSLLLWSEHVCRDSSTWKMENMMTVRGRFPENSAILNMSIPQRLISSISWRDETKHLRDMIVGVCVCVCVSVCVHGPTLANMLSCGVFTPKRGIQVDAMLGLCVAFFTPLICDIGLFFFSFSLTGGDRISTSCCFSVMWTYRHRCIPLFP